ADARGRPPCRRHRREHSYCASSRASCRECVEEEKAGIISPMEQEQSSKFLIPSAIVVAGALVAFAIYAGGAKSPAALNQATPEEITVPAVTDKDHVRGNPDAQVTIIEYSDTECPFCKTFHNTLKTLTTSYGDKVAWVYRQFPIAQLHSKAPNE